MAKSQASGSTTGQLGERNLSVIHAIGQSLAIGPIFSAAVISSLVAGVAGFGSPLSVLLGSLGTMALGYVVTLYARRYAGAGAIYEYLSRGLSPVFGTFAAGLYFIGSLFLGAGGIYIFIGILTQSFFQTHLNHTSIAWWIGGIVVLVLVAVMNYFGVRIAISSVLALAGVAAIPLLFVSIVIIAKGGANGNTLSAFTTQYSSLNSVFKGILYAVTLFIGFEAAASIAEECREPRRAIPIAVLSAIGMVSVFYLVVTYAADIGYGVTAVNKGAWASSASPISDLATKYVGSWLGAVIDLVIILDMISLSIALMVTVSRGFFALGRDGMLPRWTSKTSRFNTPAVGIGLVTIWSVLLLIWAGSMTYSQSIPLPPVLQSFFLTTTVGSYLVEIIYLFLSLVAFKLLWEDGARGAKDIWKYVVVLGAAVTPVLGIVGQLNPFPPAYPYMIPIWASIACIVIVLVWVGFLMTARADLMRTAALYALEDAEIAPYSSESGVAQVTGTTGKHAPRT